MDKNIYKNYLAILREEMIPAMGCTEPIALAYGCLLYTSSSKEKTQQAEVIAVGGGKVVDGKEVPVQVKPGDRVIYGKYTGTEIKYEGEKYLVINADDIIAIVKD